jgi:meso-butanediol dehydrogenase/(S,S)-butanediol dehydrogenase/diacetyl reductase
VVTGGGSGIGKAITDQFVSQGATVVVGQRSNSEAGDHCAVDLANSKDCERLIKYTADTYGRIDGLINNAGTMQVRCRYDAGTMQVRCRKVRLLNCQWKTGIAVNLTAPFLLIKPALPHLFKSKGAIVNIGSIEGLGSNPSRAAYCAAKGGLHALTRAIAVDSGADQVLPLLHR